MGATRDRAAESMAAAILGDALGRPFNGLKQGHVQQLLGAPAEGFLPPAIHFPDRPERNVLPGIHGAAGQRLLACLACAADDPMGRDPAARAGARMIEIAGDADGMGAWRNPGRPLRRAVARWREQYPWEAADYHAADEESDGAGAAVCGIAAVLADPARPADTAETLARQTHRRVMAVGAARFIADTFVRLLECGGGRKLDAGPVLRPAIDSLRAWEADYLKRGAKDFRDLEWHEQPRLSTALEPLPSLLAEASDPLAAETIVRTCAAMAPAQAVTHPQHGFAGACIPWALFRALGPMAPRLAVEDAMNRGGESSLACALILAFAVARHGTGCIPEEWIDGCATLASARRAIAEPNAATLAALLADEQRWTFAEQELRAPLEKAAEARRRDEAKAREAEKPTVPSQSEAVFAPPPHLWLKEGDEEDPRTKRILREARGRRRIDWKEDRRKQNREQGGD